MAKPTGFIEYSRKDPHKRKVSERIKDYNEIEQFLPLELFIEQAARCMDCGVPSCHSYGCPVVNRIPDWNDMIYHGHWQRALDLLHSTNNFPEVTGRICPAPCETACTLGINDSPVTIRHIELQIIERGFQEGWVHPQISEKKTGKRVAIVGSGPAGLAAAQQLARAGHDVTVFEKDDRIGGLLRYGIPDFKMEKHILSRRLDQMRAEGVRFETEVNVGYDISPRFLRRSFETIMITAGATVPRDLDVLGRDLNGIHFAMDFLTQQNKIVSGDSLSTDDLINAKGKDVVVIGGGDTGSDCVGTSNRQGAKSITQIEILSKPLESRDPENPWPEWPNIMRSTTSHEEGCERKWSVLTKSFNGVDGQVQSLECVDIEWSHPDETGRRSFKEIPGSEFKLKADLILLATGFVHVKHGPLIKKFDLKLDGRGNIQIDSNYMTNAEGVFAAGDSVTGASLVVRAIAQGRKAAEGLNYYLNQLS
ncbi:glutamate synthase subunit beta [candidate division KSB1 bacterium]|nr:glutamate synthase subunit beta [candidate division KSB1 bacterium]